MYRLSLCVPSPKTKHMPRFFLTAGALCAGLAVMLGAFGAHALQSLVTEARLQTFETAVRYQIYHSLGLLLIGVLLEKQVQKPLCNAGYLMLAGIVIFSGSLYLLVLTDTAWLGAITPIGGVCFISGWLLLAVSVRKRIPSER